MSITFETQEDFDNAVMEVLRTRLGVQVRLDNIIGYYDKDGIDVRVSLVDYGTCDDIAESSDSITF